MSLPRSGGAGWEVAENSQTGNGVYGQSGSTASAFTAGIGVGGITDRSSGSGVLGENTAAGGVGVVGSAVGDGTGVSGSAGSGG